MGPDCWQLRHVRRRVLRVNAKFVLHHLHEHAQVIHFLHNALELLHLPNVSSDLDASFQLIHNLADCGIVAASAVGKRLLDKLSCSHLGETSASFFFLHVVDLCVGPPLRDARSVQAARDADNRLVWTKLDRSTGAVQELAATDHIPHLCVELGLLLRIVQLREGLEVTRVATKKLLGGRCRRRPLDAPLLHDQRELSGQLRDLVKQKCLLLPLRRVPTTFHAGAELVAELLGVGAVNAKEGTDATLTFLVALLQIGTHGHTHPAAGVVELYRPELRVRPLLGARTAQVPRLVQDLLTLEVQGLCLPAAARTEAKHATALDVVCHIILLVRKPLH
mmetsp:Transcript_6296/g.14337  ORF Transcript_6296/g.14337 Transcript_6296/m.14337 type:complete len:335 (-) Transcript_6296:94-1098(-)